MQCLSLFLPERITLFEILPKESQKQTNFFNETFCVFFTQPVSQKQNIGHLPKIMDWSMFNEYLLLEVFTYLPIQDLNRACQVCKFWNFVSNDDWLWKRQFQIQYQVQNPTLPPFAKSWKGEIKRLLWSIPTTQSQPEPLKNPHCDEITHVTFSNDGNYFATCGRDSLIILWSAQTYKVVDYEDLTTYGWQTAQFCDFNPESSMLMVSGLLSTDHMGRYKGEIMVFTLKGKLRICSRISNR